MRSNKASGSQAKSSFQAIGKFATLLAIGPLAARDDSAFSGVFTRAHAASPQLFKQCARLHGDCSGR